MQSVKSGRYPRIKAMSYWHENWKNDGTTFKLRLDSSPKVLAAYREEIADPFFVTEAKVVTISQSPTSQTTTTIISTAEITTSLQTASPETTLSTKSLSQQPVDLNAIAALAAAAVMGLIALAIIRVRKRSRS